MYENLVLPCIFVQCDHTPLSTACEYRKEEIVRHLLTLPDIDVAMATEPTDHDSEARERTALHIAAAHNSTSIVDLLIEKKHSLTIQDKNVSEEGALLSGAIQ
jgi:ankyrin repeat protein